MALSILVQIWKARNKLRYEELNSYIGRIMHACREAIEIGFKNIDAPLHISVQELEVLHKLKLPTKAAQAPKIVEFYWGLPPKGIVKVNVDGASKGNPGKAGWGAVYRDHEGRLLGVYIGGLGVTTNYNAETAAVINGIQKALEKGWLNIWAEGDSESVIKGFQSNNVHWRYRNLWNQLQQQAHSIILSHNKREANFGADMCARKGIHLELNQKSWWDSKPPFALALENPHSAYFRFS